VPLSESEPPRPLSKRETEIMEVVYRRGRATAADVHAELPDPPGYSSVRKQLEILERKGYLRHEKDGRRYVFSPTIVREEASSAALRRVVRNFFRGNVRAAMVALVSLDDVPPTEEELNRILDQAEQARRRGR
jgi:predicted transcriptional regulator